MSWTDDHIHFKCWQICHFGKVHKGLTTFHDSQKDVFFFCFVYITYSTTFTEVISVSLLFEIICHWYEDAILCFMLSSLRFSCYNWVKLDIAVEWNEKMMPSIEPTNMTGFFMGQNSHMLPKLSCLSNWLCQSMNLAPHAIEEWDNESLSLSLCLSVWDLRLYFKCTEYCTLL